MEKRKAPPKRSQEAFVVTLFHVVGTSDGLVPLNAPVDDSTRPFRDLCLSVITRPFTFKNPMDGWLNSVIDRGFGEKQPAEKFICAQSIASLVCMGIIQAATIPVSESSAFFVNFGCVGFVGQSHSDPTQHITINRPDSL